MQGNNKLACGVCNHDIIEYNKKNEKKKKKLNLCAGKKTIKINGNTPPTLIITLNRKQNYKNIRFYFLNIYIYI